MKPKTERGIPLIQVSLGTDFYQPNFKIYGRLVKVNECRAYVKIFTEGKDVEFDKIDPETGKMVNHHFVANGGRFDNWSPHVTVIPLKERYEG